MANKKGPSFIGFSDYRAGFISADSAPEESKMQKQLNTLKYEFIHYGEDKNIVLEVTKKIDSAIKELQNRREPIEEKLIDVLNVIKDINIDVRDKTEIKPLLKKIIVNILETGKAHSSLNSQKELVEIANKIEI